MRVLQVGLGKRRFPFASVFMFSLIVGTLSILPKTARAGYYAVTYSGGSAVWENGSSPYSLDSNGWWSGFAAPSASYRAGAYASCTGAITTIFTWTPSYLLDPEPPPTKAVIYQETNATVSGSGSGTVNDGLGGSNGVGKRYSIKDNPGASFTLATISPSATIGPFGYGVAIASVKYRASASPLQVLIDGTWLKRRYLIGQRVEASLVSGGLTPTSYNWSATGGEPFKRWQVTWNAADMTINNTTAALLPLGSQTYPTLICYFKRSAGTATATCTAHLTVPQGAIPASGLDVTVSRECEIVNPESFSFDVYTAQNAANHPDGNKLQLTPPATGVVLIQQGNLAELSFQGVDSAPVTDTLGVRWDGKVLTSSANPNPWNANGGWNFVQKAVIKRFRGYPGTSSTIRQKTSVNEQNLLDVAFPYEPEPYADSTGYPGTFPADGIRYIRGDFPLIRLESNYTEAQADDHFETWMMYRPPGTGSEFVPIKKITWYWTGDANKVNGTWYLFSKASGFTIGNDYPEFPEWTGRVTPTALSTWITIGN